ncbi:SDR family NAD(P)-dependent oxidoreductase [Piscinibacter sp.]|uniref:SDR family NAD(P)-dependent oxidoreductase n=1 Tax=Piscinibacter sp. TaxID=1903157 RepID=UPI002B9262C9|nr:SDR family oxidoreductase [Albitalea sp.]HUG21791.1 SDR family oxidoreductase [Albitalea sp.]
MNDRLNLRTVVITGAAGALGQAVAQHFLDDGCHLALIDQDEARLRSVFAARAGAEPHLLLAADVTSQDSMQTAAGRILQAFGHVDVLVHVAGGFEMGEATHRISRASWQRMMDLNAWSFVAVTQDIVEHMRGRGAGKVIAVSARSAERGAAAMGAYGASKSALQRLVEALSHEVRGHGINVNSIAPTILDTPANRQAMPDADRSVWVATAVAARAVGYLASDAAAPVHGQHLVLGA